MNSQEAIKTLRDALTRLRNECDSSGLRGRISFSYSLNVADEALAATSSIEQAANTNRAEFDGYIKRKFPHSWQLDLHINIHGEYVSMQIQAMFEAWQAARVQPKRVVLSDAEIVDMAKQAGFVAAPSGPVLFCEVTQIRTLLSAQADPIRCNSTGLESPITQPMIAEAARDDRVEYAHIDWTEISQRGLLERINREIMHPIGLAVFRDPKTGTSGGAFVSPDGIWEYSEAIKQDDVAGDAGASSIEDRMEAQAKPFAAYLTEDDFHDLHRFMECCEDSESGGHDVSKDRMRRLAELGVVRSCGFGRHEATAFGCYVHDGVWLQSPELPLRTIAERIECAAIAASKEAQ